MSINLRARFQLQLNSAKHLPHSTRCKQYSICTRRAGSKSPQTTMTSFRALEKAILSPEQLAAFQSSKTYAKVTSYIEALNNAVVGYKLTDECSQSQVRSRLNGHTKLLTN